MKTMIIIIMSRENAAEILYDIVHILLRQQI